MTRSYLPVALAAKQLGCSESRLYDLVRKGKVSNSWTFLYPQRMTVNLQEVRVL